MDHAIDNLGTVSRHENSVGRGTRESNQTLGPQNSGAADAASMAVSARDARVEFAKLHDELGRIIPMFPHQQRTPARTLATLRSVLRAQKRKGREGHWSYDYARHCGLIRLFDKMHAAAKRCEVKS